MRTIEELKVMIYRFKKKSLQQKIKVCETHWKFVSIVTSIATAIVFFLCKILYFSYYKGVYSVYNLDDSYINMSNDAVIIKIIKTLFITVLLIISNYWFYLVGTSEDNGWLRLKRKGKTFGYILLEMMIIVCVSTVPTDFTIIQVLKEFFKSSAVEKIKLLILALLVVCMINMMAIVICIEKNERFFRLIYNKIIKKFFTWIYDKIKNNDKQDNVNEKTKKDERYSFIGRILIVVVCISIALCLETIIMYSAGKTNEQNRKDFRVIIEKAEKDEETEFKIEKEKINIYRIIYEDNNGYIVSKIDKEVLEKNNDISKVFEQKKVKKENIETYYCEDIYDMDSSLELLGVQKK